MKLCKDCDDLTMICDFCRYSIDAEYYNTNEYLWCTKHNQGVDVVDDACEDFYCVNAD